VPSSCDDSLLVLSFYQYALTAVDVSVKPGFVLLEGYVVGRLVVTLPGLGRFVAGLANPFVLAAVWGLAALVLGLSFLPEVAVPKPDMQSIIKTATGSATALMVGLVVVSAGITLSPAHAAGLKAHSAVITAQVHACPPPSTSGTCT
jgi:hypothetical protein